MNDLAKNDYWRAVMYDRLRESLSHESVSGEGVEFGGSNGIIQNMFPHVVWEVRRFPNFDVTNESSYERSWDVIVTDQVLEHTEKPWEAMRLIGEHTTQIAIITVPFLIGIHNSPHDFWRMTPKAIHMLAKPYFPHIDIQTWGTPKANNWHAIYNRTSRLIAAVPEAELEAELADNNTGKPFVIWAILKK
ncbi:MAG: hypothetical protein Q7S31_00065 [bacterium]|nr:hypothetical protein [bacterium]